MFAMMSSHSLNPDTISFSNLLTRKLLEQKALTHYKLLNLMIGNFTREQHCERPL